MAEVYVGRKFKTKFVEGVKEDGRIQTIISAGKKLNSLGLTPENAGNISARTKKGMLITVGGVNKGVLTDEDVVEVVSFDGETAKVVGGKEPSSETPMHWMIYQKFMNANAVIHVHDQKVLEKAAELNVQTTEHKVHYGTEEQAAQVVEALKKSSYVAIREHGVLCVGDNVGQVLSLVVSMHEKADSID
jgi:L-fuculose-phosphate aldolase